VAHSLSAQKRVRQNLKRRVLNRARTSGLKGRIRRVTEVLSGADPKLAEQSIREACKALDREANRGLIHANAAARRKSRMMRKLNALRAAKSK
jgi:small subunit ribosomal protein S20